ncbi:hypothetical protein EV132_101234 [Rhizobium sullae]|uniref:Uncharacterized protein n=1 Tax=Rhizobium sullae TaxID=50338 RepID=A0A4R3QET0_RHISU|nr:hypothetical protein EV132_101234 [Rhizobium sullae]
MTSNARRQQPRDQAAEDSCDVAEGKHILVMAAAIAGFILGNLYANR